MFSGGEPTIHPQILEFMEMALDKGVRTVNLNTNGIKLAHDRGFVEALSKMTLKTPTGDVKLDENRQAIGTTFITEVVKDEKGNFYNKVVKKIDNVNQTLGLSKSEFQIGSRDVPACP